MALPHDECVSITRVCSRFCRVFSLMWSTESSKNLDDSSDRWHNRLCCARTSPLKPCCPQLTCSSTSTFLERPAYKQLSQHAKAILHPKPVLSVNTGSKASGAFCCYEEGNIVRLGPSFMWKKRQARGSSDGYALKLTA